MIGFGFSVFTQAILGLGGGFRGSALNLDFTSGNRTLDPRITFSRTTNATLTNSAGLIANAPMNLLTFSEQFDNAAWAKANATVTANTVVAPDGTLTADKLVEDTSASTFHQVQQNLTVVSGTVYTLSAFVKAAGRSFVNLYEDSGSVGASAWFNLSDGTVGTVASGGVATITPAGNGWFRCSITYTQTGTIGRTRVAAAPSNGTISYTGNGTSGIYIWGAQLEIGSTATTYNPTTVKNLLGFTEHFDNAAWTKSNASISATKVDDIYGQPFAQKLVENTAAGLHYFDQATTTISGTAYTGSVYLKAGERSWARVQFVGSLYFPNIYVNLADGSVGTVENSPLSYSVTDVGQGWYRVSMSAAVDSASTRLRVYSATANGTVSHTGDGTSGIYIFGAQLSDSASVDPYVYNPVAAPSSVAYYGPRFDYDPVTLAPKGLLIEEQRTNLLTYSEQFDNAAWIKPESSVTANASVSPDGAATADKLIASTATASHITTQSPTVVSGTIYTFSVYLKAAEYETALVGFIGGSGFRATSTIVVNLATGAISAETSTLLSSSVVSAGNGWWRVAVLLAASTSAAGSVYVGVVNGTTYADRLNAGNGTSGIYIWGAQLEAGSQATSYIPTVASQVTRAADSASMVGNNFARWYNATQGTLFAQFDTPAAGNRPVLSVGDGTANNMIQLRTEATDPYFRVTTGGVAQVGLDIGTVAANTTYKMTGAYEANNFSACINAGTVGSDASGTVPVVTRMLFGSDQAGSYLNGHISRAAAYGRVLAATEQQGVTA